MTSNLQITNTFCHTTERDQSPPFPTDFEVSNVAGINGYLRLSFENVRQVSHALTMLTICEYMLGQYIYSLALSKVLVMPE